MGFSNYVIMFAVILTGCGYQDPKMILADRTMQYQIKDNKYAVIVIEDNLSEERAKEQAMRKAAEMTVTKGDRYFVIESQGHVAAMKSNTEFGNSNSGPSNIYYELIQSGNFGRERTDQVEPSEEGTYPAWRIEFSTYKE